MKHFLQAHFYKIYIYLTIVFTPILPSLLWLGFFVAVDLFTAILRARKAKTPITSKKMSQTVTKLALYFIAIICGHILDTQFLNVSWLPVKTAQLISGYIAVVEFKSIIENISDLLGMPIWKFIKAKIYREENK